MHNEAAVKSLQLHQIAKYGYVAAEMLVVADILLTLDLEVNLVWARRRTSPGKILFLLNRYLPAVNMAVDLYFVRIPCIDCVRAKTPAILALKTYALYQTRWSIYLLGFGVVVPSLMVTTTTIYTYRNALDWNILFPGTGCALDCTKNICTISVVMYWAQFSGLDTVVVWLTAWRAYTVSRARREIVRDSPEDQMYPYSSFWRLLFRDELIYYSSCAILNILAVLTGPRELILFSVSMTRAIQTVACSR
ncbi:hypothetical protein C8J56DRAFT_888256 [Mycena floridula]|nr:hypothetical protein C8J56DRAFT_888256 [Mycena floridula]